MSGVAVRSLAPLALMGAIFYFSAQESVGPDLPAYTRVIAHFTEYAILAALWAWALVPAHGRRGLWIAAALSAVYAVADEYHQSFVEGRDSDPLDVIVDWTGITVALVLVSGRLVRRRARVSGGENRTPTEEPG